MATKALKPKLTFKKNKKGEVTSAVLENVALFYTKVQSPQAIYEQRKMSKPNKFEYSVNAVVTEEIADEFDEMFEKQTSKKYTNAKFREKFKLEEDDKLPFPKAKKQFVLSLKQAAQKADGSKLPKSLRPRVVELDEDGKPVDITKKKLVGNGSVGDILLRVNTNDFGTFAYLSIVKVTDLLEYEAGGDEDREDFLGGQMEFDDDDEDDTPSGGDDSDDDDDGADSDDDDDTDGFGDDDADDDDDDDDY